MRNHFLQSFLSDSSAGCGPEDRFLLLDHTRHTQAKINGVPGPNDSQLCWPECGPETPQAKTSRDGSFICYAK